jgi:hypothetical protein
LGIDLKNHFATREKKSRAADGFDFAQWASMGPVEYTNEPAARVEQTAAGFEHSGE